MKKKVLVVSAYPFLPTRNGTTKVILEYCNILKELGCELFYCCAEPTSFSKEMRQFFGERLFYYRKPLRYKLTLKNLKAKLGIRPTTTGYNHLDDYCPSGLNQYVENLHQRFGFDLCIANYVTLSQIFEGSSIPRKALFTHDAFTHKKEILGGVKTFWFDLKPSSEAKGVRRATDILSIQENESVLYHYYNPKANIYTVFSTFDLHPQPLTGNNRILFVASDNAVNRNGIEYFLDNVFPLVRQHVADATVCIGGSVCKSLSQYAETEGVKLEGFVDDLANFYALGDIVVNPVFQGTGLKVKTFEALAFGKIAIVHKHSTEGIYKPNQAPLIAVNNAKDYADALVRVLSDNTLRQTLQQEAITYIKELNQYVINQYKELIQ